MTMTPLTRRRAAIALACLPFAAGALAAREVIELRYFIARDTHEPSGDVTELSFEGAMLIAPGEHLQTDIRDQYRIDLTMTQTGDVAHVRMKLWDNRRTHDDDFVGVATADVPIGGDAHVVLLSSANIHYPIRLSATRRVLS